MKLVINEIFYSLQGETTTAGLPSLFIRFTGCNLRCTWCDTTYAYEKGSALSIEEIMTKVRGEPGIHHVTITGGEPLCQQGVHSLIGTLCDEGYSVQVETNGSMPLKAMDRRARKIVDVKTPSSGEGGSFLMENLDCIGADDEIKFIIGDEKDYSFAKNFYMEHLQDMKTVVNFSPVFGKMPYHILASYILRDRITVRLNLQLHRIARFEEESDKERL